MVTVGFAAPTKKLKLKYHILGLFVAGMTLGVCLHWALSLRGGHGSTTNSSSQPTGPQTPSERTPTNQAWGELVYTPFTLSLPEEFFPQIPPATGSLKWFFNHPSAPELGNFIHSLDLPDSQRSILLDTNRWTATNQGFYISVPPELVVQLSPVSRHQIYSVLAQSEQNVGHRYPFRFSLPGFATRFQRTELSPDKAKLVQSLTWTNHGTVCFSDLETCRHLFSASDTRKLLQTFYESPTFILKLRVTRDSNLDALVQYWGAGQRAREIKPVLESLMKTPEPSEISVSSLLPPLPQMLLYTFPSPLQNGSKARRDCFWTSLNFFNEQPDDRFLDGKYTQQTLESDYQPVEGPPRYGDLVAVLDSNGSIMHVCVYIAADVVFTKNGVGELQPWVFMRLPDMKLKYASLGSVQFSVLRKKSATS